MSIKKNLEDLSSSLKGLDFSKNNSITDLMRGTQIYNHNYGSNPEYKLNSHKGHPMEKTIEFKILKFLNKNDNGEFIDLPIDFGTVKFLKQKILELKKKGFINTKSYPGYASAGDSVIQGINKPPKCRITFDGKQFLLDENKIITSQYIDNSKNETYNGDVGVISKGDNYRNQSSFKDSKNIKNKQNNIPNPKDIKQYPIISFMLKHLFKILGTLLIIGVGVLIDNDIIDVSWFINLFK